MKRNEDFRKALGQPDEYFRQSVIDTLDQLNTQAEKENRPQRRYAVRLACTFAALVLAITGLSLSGVRIPGIPTESHVDAIRPTPTVAAQLTAKQSNSAEYNPASDVQSDPDLSKKYAQGVVINTQPESNTVESDLATVTLRKADTDGYGIFLSFEVIPRHEKTLIVDINVDPYMDSPGKIGLTPDRSGQTILEWAVEHGFEQLLDVDLFSAHDDYDPTYTAGFHSYPRTPEEDGSVIVDVYGGTLSNTDLYYLCCRAVPWDMNGKNTYRDIPNGREIELALLYDQAVYTYLKIPVTGEKETPEFIAAYCSDADAQGSSFTASLFRTSLAEYCETWTDNPDYADNWFSSLLTIPSGSPVFTHSTSTPLHALIRQENGSVIFRDTVILPKDCPDMLSLEFTNIQDANQVDPPVTMKKMALNPDIPTESHVDAIRPTPTVAAQLTADLPSASDADQSVPRIPSVETDLATLTVRNPKIIGSHIKLQVEVMPKAEKTLALNWSIHPYTDRVTKIGKTPDYAGQSIMQWANDHGYTLLRVVFGNAFEPEIPGVLPDIDSPKTGPIQAPAFDSIFIDQSTYEDSGATVITVSGDTLPDAIDYMLGFVLQTWDNTKTDFRDYENAFHSDGQIFGNIPFRTEAEIIETVALYTSHPHPFKSDSDLEYTAAFYKTTYGEYMEVRTNDLSLTATFRAYNLRLMSRLSSHQFLVLYDFWATRVYPDSANIDSPLESECYQTEDGWLVVRCPCVISELPDILDLDVVTSHCNLTKVESGWNNWGEEIDRSTVISTGPENNTLETELANLKLLQAETDDQNLLFSFKVSPLQDHTLVISGNINPEQNSPLKIGLTPDRAGQTIAEWALKHGYDQVMAIDLFSPSVEECPTRDAKCRTAIRAAGQDGSAILDVRGSILADKALYDLCCTISVSNLAGHYTYTDDGAGGSGTTFTATYTQDAHTFLKVSVPGGEETPVTRN